MPALLAVSAFGLAGLSGLGGRITLGLIADRIGATPGSQRHPQISEHSVPPLCCGTRTASLKRSWAYSPTSGGGVSLRLLRCRVTHFGAGRANVLPFINHAMTKASLPRWGRGPSFPLSAARHTSLNQIISRTLVRMLDREWQRRT